MAEKEKMETYVLECLVKLCTNVEKKLPEGCRKSLLNLCYHHGWKSENRDVCIGMSSQNLQKMEWRRNFQKFGESLY